MKVIVRGLKGVDPAVTEMVRGICAKLSTATEVRHRLRVLVVPGMAVQCPVSGGCGFAAFGYPDGKPEIIVAGLRIPDIRARQHFSFLAETIAHEFAHYEQWRDGRTVQERGVNVRGRGLLRKAGYQVKVPPRTKRAA